MKCFYCLLLMLCPYFAMAQPPVLTSISPGDKVPDISFTNMLNYKSPSAKLSAFKGKLVILDFWATWCSNCIKKFNLLDSMQRQHSGKLQVILVSGTGSRDSKEKIEAYLNKHRNSAGATFAMPAAYNDELVKKYFPHTGVPHYVWIGAGGICLAITKSEDVTEANIHAVLQGTIPVFNSLALMEDFDFNKPLFADGNAGDGSGMMARSTLSHYIPGMAPVARYSRNKDNLVTQYKLVNQPLLEMVKKAYDLIIRNDRIVFKVADSVKSVLVPATPGAKRAGSFTYELICPPLLYNEALKLVQQDMQRYFGLYATWEKLPAPCYNLTVDTTLVKPYISKGGKSLNKLYDPNNKYLQNGKLKSLADYLNHTTQHYVLLQTATPYMLDISLPNLAEGNDAALIQALAKMGIVLTPATATVSQFVIHQTPKPTL